MENNNLCVVFDLDDTLYYEIDFVKSAYQHIARIIDKDNPLQLANTMISKFLNKEKVFEWVLETYSDVCSLNMDFLINEYRYHMPQLILEEDTRFLLDIIKSQKIHTGLITDGRAISQRNKLKSLGLESYFDIVIISEEIGTEKPDIHNYQPFNIAFPSSKIIYVADNTSKDFSTPDKLGWMTFCLKNRGGNIHMQDITKLPHRSIIINSLKDLLNYL